jgi:hypothetical protein
MYYSLAELESTAGLIAGFVGGSVVAGTAVVVWQVLLPKRKAGWGTISLFWSAICSVSILTATLFQQFKLSRIDSEHSLFSLQNIFSVVEFPGQEPNLFFSMAVLLAYCIPLAVFLSMRFKRPCVIASMGLSLCCWCFFMS